MPRSLLFPFLRLLTLFQILYTKFFSTFHISFPNWFLNLNYYIRSYISSNYIENPEKLYIILLIAPFYTHVKNQLCNLSITSGFPLAHTEEKIILHDRTISDVTRIKCVNGDKVVWYEGENYWVHYMLRGRIGFIVLLGTTSNKHYGIAFS